MKVPKLSQHKRRAYAMNIVAHNHQSRELLSSKISRFLEEFHVGRILQACNAYKVRGFSVKDVFQVAFENAFSSKSFFQKQRESSTSIPFAKDTFYRFFCVVPEIIAYIWPRQWTHGRSLHHKTWFCSLCQA